MNTPGTFKLGWALFAGCFMTGAGIGYAQSRTAQEQRRTDLVQQVADRNASLDKLEAKWRSEGSKKFRPAAATSAEGKGNHNGNKDSDTNKPP